MKVKRGVYALLPATVLLAALTSGTSATAKPPVAMQCKPVVTGHGTSVAKPTAQSKARNLWRAKVKALFGNSWADLTKAKVLGFPCTGSGYHWSCTLRAQPCKELGFKSPG